MINFAAMTWPVVVFAMTGKFFIAIAFASLYVVTSEVYSTSIRGLGLTINSSSARIGSTVGVYAGLLVSLCSVNCIFVIFTLWLPTFTFSWYCTHFPIYRFRYIEPYHKLCLLCHHFSLGCLCWLYQKLREHN